MLGLGIDVDVDVKKVKFPIYFENKNICVHCGGQGTLIFVDKFGRESNKDIHAFDHIKCTKCGRVYSILWEPDGKTMHPTAINPSVKAEFSNLVKHLKLSNNGEKKFN